MSGDGCNCRLLAVLLIVCGLVLLALAMTGCATPPPAKAAPPQFVAVFVFIDHCDRAFEEAAFVRSDGSIVETTDDRQALEWATTYVPQHDHGKFVPIYTHDCLGGSP